MREERPLGVAVIGLGVGFQHALAYARNDRCELRWVFDLDRGRMKHVAIVIGHGAPAESVEAILADTSVDVVSIASYDDAHFQQVISSLDAGKHVFVEKPLCRSLDEVQAVKLAWNRSGDRHLASNLVLRAAPLYRWLKAAIESGDLGEIYALDGEYLYGRLQKITEGWRRKVDGYSVMLGGGVHLVDLMLGLSRQKPVSVTASGNRICAAGTDFRYNDYAATTFQFDSGLIGRITANFGCVHPHQHVVRVFGTKGTFICDDLGPRLHTGRDPSIPAKRLDLSGLPASQGDLIPGFIDGIVAGRDTRSETQHELDVISVCASADLAMATGSAVKVVYV